MSRAVASRTLNDNNGHSYTWNYNWGTASNGSLVNTVTDPLGNDTVHGFTALSSEGSSAGCFFYETRTQDYQGTGSSRQLLKQVDTTYSSQAFGVATSAISVVGNVVPTSIQTTVYPSGKVSLVTKSYDTGLGSGAPIFANVVTEKDYDWGQGSAGALVREIDRTYQWQNDSRYLTAHLLDLAGSEVVKDGSGCRQAETDYTYDEPAYLSVSGISTHHGTPPNPSPVRGNPTSVTRQQFASNSCPTTTQSGPTSHTNWYDTGEIYQQIDPLSHTTTHSYDPYYVGAYSTQTCNALSQCVSGTYDFNTGLLTSFTDANASSQASGNTSGDPAHTSSYQYNDPLWRITQAQSPPDASGNRPQTTFTYSAANSFPLNIQRTKSITTTLNDIATNYFDGLGRVYKSQHATPNGTSTVDTTYDAFDHAVTVSNPYFSTSDPTYGVIQTQYDALGRATQVTKQDGSMTLALYNQTAAASGNTDCTMTTDEAGRQRRNCSDALGRLIEVDEPLATGAPASATASVTLNGGLASFQTSAPPPAAAGSGLAGFADPSGNQHWAYLGGNQHLYNLYWNGSAYSFDDVTGASGAPVAAGTAMTGFPDGSDLWAYLGSNGHIYNLYWNSCCGYGYQDATSASGAPGAASGSPVIGFADSSGGQHWAFMGTNQHVYNIYWNSCCGYGYGDVTAIASAPAAASGSALSAFGDPSGGQHWAYFGTNQHLYHIWWTSSSGFTVGDANSLSGAPLASVGSALAGYAANSGAESWTYLDANQHIYNLYLNNCCGYGWADLTAATGAPLAVSGSAVAGFLDTSQGQHWAYLGTNQHVYNFYWNSCCGYGYQDATAGSGAPAANSGSAMVGFEDPSGGQHWAYFGSNQHVYNIWWNSGYGYQDVNAAADLVFDSGTVSLNLGGFTATACFGASTNSACTGHPSNTTASQVASALANAINVSSSPATATVSGSTINLIWKTPGPTSAQVAALTTSHDNSSLFSSPSFTSSPENFSVGVSAALNTPYITLYGYDALGNLLNVTQKGGTTDSTQWRVRSFTYDSHSRLLTANNPESGTITYGYDADGNLVTKTDARGITANFNYDALHRMTAKSFSDGTFGAGYTYDQTGVWGPNETNTIGRLVLAYDGHYAATLFSYDALGRVTTQWDCPPSTFGVGCPVVQAQYDLVGDVTQLAYPNGEVVKYTPDSAGRMISAADTGNNINFANNATYGPDNSLTGFVSGNSGSFAGITNTLFYNNRLQPCRITASSTGAVPTNCTNSSGNVLDLSYDFHWANGNNGNVYAITNYRDQSRNQTFTYDALNRVISAQNAGTDCTKRTLNGATEYWGNSYSYDAWGNLLQKNVTKCSAESLGVIANTKNQVHMNSGPDYSFDAAGNMTHDATTGNNYSFDGESRVAQVNSGGVAYTYDPQGARVRKDVSGQPSTEYYYFGDQILAEKNVSTSAWTNYVFFNGRRVARKDANGVFYYFSDELKTADVITDAAGNIKAESDYYPWGGELQLANADSNHYKFTGKERDAETGLDYFGARYYGNWLGRFITPDWAAKPTPVPYAEVADPQSLGLYSYVRNGPTSRVDPLGHDWFKVKNQWQWQKGHKFVDPKTGKVISTRGYRYLLRFDPTKTAAGTTTGKLTLFDQNKEIAHSTAFSGGAEGSPRIPVGSYMLRLDLPHSTLSGDDLRVQNGRLALRPSYGVQDIPKTIGDGVEAQPDWGTKRAYLNPMPGETDQSFQGQYLHGKGDPNITSTHGCLADRSEHMMDEILKLGPVHLPVDVH